MSYVWSKKPQKPARCFTCHTLCNAKCPVNNTHLCVCCSVTMQKGPMISATAVISGIMNIIFVWSKLSCGSTLSCPFFQLAQPSCNTVVRYQIYLSLASRVGEIFLYPFSFLSIFISNFYSWMRARESWIIDLCQFFMRELYFSHCYSLL